MKKLLSILLLLISFTGYAQMNTFGGVGFRVNDTTTYQTNAAAYHSAGYHDIYFNNQATSKHWDVWNGSAYMHVKTLGWSPATGGGGGSGDVVGPSSATNNVPVLFDGTTGKLVKNSTPTGTGNPVLATAPTMSDPVVGTQSASDNSTKAASTAFVKASSPKVYSFAFSDEISVLTTGAAKITFSMPYAMTVTNIYCSVKTGQTGGSLLTIDINESGATILSTKITIDNNETDSYTAATPAVISDTSLALRSVMTVDIDLVGTGVPVGGKCDIIGY